MRSSVVLTSALAAGALAIPHVQLEKRVLVTEVDWEIVTVTVYVTVGYEPSSTSASLSTDTSVPESKSTEAYTLEVLPSPSTPAQTPSATARPRPSQKPESHSPRPYSSEQEPPSESEPSPSRPDYTPVPEISPLEDYPQITRLYQRPQRPVFTQASRPPPNPVYTPPRPLYTPPAPVYTPPRFVYTPPAPVYTPPRSVYVPPPSPVYTPPRPVYTLPPSPVYTPPRSVYTPPLAPIATLAPAPRPTTTSVYTPPPANTSPVSLPSNPAGSHTSGASQAYLSSGPEYQAAILYHHNAARANHNAAPLTWDANCAATALQAANTCNFAHYIPAGVRQGQNLFTVSGSAFNVTAGITESWYKGELNPMLPYFGKANIPDDVFHSVGHLTQMVWKGTTSVGCVSIDCGSKMMVGGKTSTMNKYTVCNYAPAGNVGGGYAINVAAPNSLTALGNWSD